MLSPTWKDIYEADSKIDVKKLDEIFKSLTAQDLNKSISNKPGSTIMMCLLLLFDENNEYPHFLKNLFNSPNFDYTNLDVDCPNAINGYIAFMYPANRGHIEIAQKLLAWGANPKIRTAQNMTPLYLAFRFDPIEMFKFLLPLVDKQEIDWERGYIDKTMRQAIMDKENDSPTYKQWADLLDEVGK